jgi:RND superfamily putative drug exporter
MIAGAGRGTAGIGEILKGIATMKAGLADAIKYVHENQQKVAARSKDGTFLFVIPVPGPAEYKAAAEGLARLADGLDQLSAGLDRMETGLKSLREGMVALEQRLAPLSDENGPYGYIARRLYLLPDDLKKNPDLQKALDRYISPDGKIMRLAVILKYPPQSLPATQAVADLSARLPDLLGDAGLPDARACLSGATPTIADVRLITQRDYYRMMALVIGGVLIILFIQFRNPVALVYLVGTVLLSYVATMGIVLLVFKYVCPWLLATTVTEIDWKVRFFMFVFMVALGEDYNIFIMSRIEEERRAHGPFLGVERAVVRTGNIISSCGLIMAGTFCAMMASPLPIIVQIGFGIACGMLVDTFLVRPILLPAIILLLAPYNLTRTPSPPADSYASRSPHAQ